MDLIKMTTAEVEALLRLLAEWEREELELVMRDRLVAELRSRHLPISATPLLAIAISSFFHWFPPCRAGVAESSRDPTVSSCMQRVRLLLHLSRGDFPLGAVTHQ